MTKVKTRPKDWICIRKGEGKESLCGRFLGFEWAFVNFNHAELSEKHCGLVLCDDCRKTAVQNAIK